MPALCPGTRTETWQERERESPSTAHLKQQRTGQARTTRARQALGHSGWARRLLPVRGRHEVQLVHAAAPAAAAVAAREHQQLEPFSAVPGSASTLPMRTSRTQTTLTTPRRWPPRPRPPSNGRPPAALAGALLHRLRSGVQAPAFWRQPYGAPPRPVGISRGISVITSTTNLSVITVGVNLKATFKLSAGSSPMLLATLASESESWASTETFRPLRLSAAATRTSSSCFRDCSGADSRAAAAWRSCLHASFDSSFMRKQ